MATLSIKGVRKSFGAVEVLNNIDIDIADDIRRTVTRTFAEVDAPQLGLL